MSKGSNTEYFCELLSPCEDDSKPLLELLSACEEPGLYLKQLNDVTDRKRVPFQDEDHPGNDPHLVLGFPRLCSGTFAERSRSLSVHVGGKKIVYLKQSAQNAGLCPADFMGQFFNDSSFNFFRNLCDMIFVNSRNGRVSWQAVPRTSFLCLSGNGCQLSFVSQCCHL